ncbi:MAG: sugar ABC transporter ATP-binding protein [Actinomycetota bacterium]
MLELREASKRYPGVRALSDVDLQVGRGEVHAVLGENGAGKSTLMKVVAGSVRPDAGRMSVDGRPVPFGSPDAARANGIAMVYQELSLVPRLSVDENVLLGRWPTRRSGTIDWARLHAVARRHLERIGLDVDGRRPVADLGMAERQLVEIAKAASIEVRVLLLDEPTSALSDPEARRLFGIVRDLSSSGVAIVYVSHRLPEVLEISDRITVLRDGARIGTADRADVDEARLVRMMLGHAIEEEPARDERGREPSEEVVLRVRGMARRPRLKPIDLEVRAGEIVCVFGLVGSGRTRLARTLFGLEPATEGEVEVSGRRVEIDSPVKAIALGIGYQGEDRSAGIVPMMAVAANVTLASLDALGHGPILDFGEESAIARRYVNELAIRTTVERLAGTLSGGNQQKVVLARWLCSGARLLVLDDPTRGIDVGAREEVFRLVRRLADQGVGVLYLTSEIREARSLGDRVLVMSLGRIAGDVPPTAADEEIMAAAGGVHG